MKRSGQRWLSLVVVAVAIANELRKPASERTWHDRLFGVVPYDFRRPTFERLKDTFWSTTNDRVLVPQFFGVGWSVNLYAVLKRLALLRGRSYVDAAFNGRNCFWRLPTALSMITGVSDISGSSRSRRSTSLS